MAGTGLAITIRFQGPRPAGRVAREIAPDRFGRERRSKRAGQESACSARTLRTDLEKRRVRMSAVGPNVVYRETAIRLESGTKWNCQVRKLIAWAVVFHDSASTWRDLSPTRQTFPP
jgi:hypothetical protein